MRRTHVVAAFASAALLVGACRLRPAETDPVGLNAGCYVCHMTFVREELSAAHLKAKVACVRCHGVSAGHANDEDIGATKPDIAYKRPQVNAHCRTCHPAHDAPPEKVLARWQERQAARAAAEPLVPAVTCTDCHGTHKIAKPGPTEQGSP